MPAGGGPRRPRLLMDAARHGLADYRRGRDLPRLIGGCPTSAQAIAELEAREEEAERARRAGSPAWSCVRHVEVLIALMAERALLAEGLAARTGMVAGGADLR
ncbi:hypothetical protein GU920_13855 [Rhodobacter sp. CCP-1]|uniref:Uncharacterized protein n=2 Tax=Paragemmobacter ruber TaxID=1985673 RepID=A0ABW9Y9C0_9RHOB|nr:hypothetical protein [Rhodobacter ruber]